jgi:hypothetical protein
MSFSQYHRNGVLTEHLSSNFEKVGEKENRGRNVSKEKKNKKSEEDD